MLRARIEAGVSLLLDKKATENGISIIAAIFATITAKKISGSKSFIKRTPAFPLLVIGV